MILNQFDHAFLINRDQDRERLTVALSRLRAVGIEAERVPAVVPAEQGPYETPGARGCIESHLLVTRLAQERGYASALVFEDDIVFRGNFLEQWALIESQVAQVSYDLFYFYDWFARAWKPWDLRVKSIDNTVCTHAYAIHSRFYDAAQRVYAENERVGLAADRIFNSSNARIYAPSYNLIGQESGHSTVDGSTKQLRWSAYTDRLLPWPLRLYQWF